MYKNIFSIILGLLLVSNTNIWAKGSIPGNLLSMGKAEEGFVAHGTRTAMDVQGQFIINAEIGQYSGEGLMAWVNGPIGTVFESYLCEYRCPNGDKGLTKCHRKVRVFEEVAWKPIPQKGISE